MTWPTISGRLYREGLFPIDYVVAVTACIFLIVLDRIIYLNRAKAAKVVYHYVTFAAFCAFIFHVYHRNGGSGNNGLLRAFFLLKSLSFALNARQVRSGYKTHGAEAGAYTPPLLSST
jgi:hypothetical protein